MKQQDLILLYTITIALDIGLVYILYTHSLVLFDKLFVWSMLLVHGLFYYGLLSLWRPLLDILHYVLFGAIFIGLFLKNMFLLGICLSLVCLIQILWVIKKQCILNENAGEFGFDELLSCWVLLWTVLYAVKIGYKWGRNRSNYSNDNTAAF